MMRSLYSAVSGLRNHQTRMDVVANNISNVNTVGFKASRVIFQDVYSQTSRSASAASGTSLGGTNPIQIGLGLKLATIDVLHNPAATQRTDNPLDIAIEGEGFFVVREGTKTYYTRAGNFYVDNVGNLVTSSGAFVQGAKSLNSIIDKLSSLFGTGDTEEWADILAAAPAGAVTGGNLAQLKTQMDTVRAALATASSAPTATNINTLNTVVNTLRGYIPTATTATATPEETKALADLKALWQTPTGTIQSALNDFSVANATKGSADANLILDKSDITGLNDYINIAIDDAGVITGIPRNSPTGSKIIIGQLAL
ncbi:MAG: flagellar hook-basal body complex protein, partial [Oscillospiraceae bacterium]|nr:flagellar hook-basal body complex protein [Oscillospiraceae bacterium]